MEVMSTTPMKMCVLQEFSPDSVYLVRGSWTPEAEEQGSLVKNLNFGEVAWETRVGFADRVVSSTQAALLATGFSWAVILMREKQLSPISSEKWSSISELENYLQETGEKLFP